MVRGSGPAMRWGRAGGQGNRVVVLVWAEVGTGREGKGAYGGRERWGEGEGECGQVGRVTEQRQGEQSSGQLALATHMACS